MKKVTTSFIFRLLVVVALATSGLWLYMHHNWLWLCLVVPLFFVSIYWFHRLYTYNTRKYNPQNEMFRLLGTKRSFSQNETFFFSHPYPLYPALFRLISHF